jgi:hypothetical protein
MAENYRVEQILESAIVLPHNTMVPNAWQREFLTGEKNA